MMPYEFSSVATGLVAHMHGACLIRIDLAMARDRTDCRLGVTVASFLAPIPDVCLPSDSGGIADIPRPRLGAKARSRCAPARCTGARAEGLVTGRERTAIARRRNSSLESKSRQPPLGPSWTGVRQRAFFGELRRCSPAAGA